MCMKQTDCRVGKAFRNTLIQPLSFTDKESESQEGKGLTQGHTAGSNCLSKINVNNISICQ